MNRYTPVGTALFALFASPTAIAQQPPSNQQPTDLHDIPQSITIVDTALMQFQRAISLADALRNVPGTGRTVMLSLSYRM